MWNWPIQGKSESCEVFISSSFPPHQPPTLSSLSDWISPLAVRTEKSKKDNVKNPRGGCGEYDLGLANSRKAMVGEVIPNGCGVGRGNVPATLVPSLLGLLAQGSARRPRLWDWTSRSKLFIWLRISLPCMYTTKAQPTLMRR